METKETDWLSGMHRHSATLTEISTGLRHLGLAFARVGNETVAAEIFDLARMISAQSEAARELTHKKVNGDYHEAVQSSSNVLKAVLAGAQMRSN